jgi:hypothetical protein
MPEPYHRAHAGTEQHADAGDDALGELEHRLALAEVQIDE